MLSRRLTSSAFSRRAFSSQLVPQPTPLATAVLAASLVLTGCGSDDSDNDSNNTAAPTVPAAPTPVEISPVTLADNSAQLAGFVRQSTPLNPTVPNPRASEGISGSAWLDYDNDGDLDLFLSNGIGFSNALLRNDNGNFTDVTAAAGLISSEGSSAVVAGDIDNDGFIDLFVAGEGRFAFSQHSANALYRNNGDGTFTDIAQTAGVAVTDSAVSSAMADINGDGLLDLFVSAPGHLDIAQFASNGALPAGAFGGAREQHNNYLFLNNGDLTFTDISQSSGIAGDGLGIGACAVAFNDFENDGDQDIFIGNCNDVNFVATPIQLMRNNGNGTFTNVATDAGVDLPGFWMSISFADIDNDGDDDFFASNFANSPLLAPGDVDPQQDFRQHALFINNGDNTYTDMADELGLAELEFSWGSSFADVNNDGYQDLYFTGSLPVFRVVGDFANPGYLFLNNQNGGFNEATQEQSGGSLRGLYTSGVSKADYDNDGFVDLLVKTERQLNPADGSEVSSGTPVLLQNGGNDFNSITVILRPANNQASAVGSTIVVSNADTSQRQSVNAGTGFASSDSPWPTFGLGAAESAQVQVRWASGLVENFGQHNAGARVELREGEGTAVVPQS